MRKILLTTFLLVMVIGLYAQLAPLENEKGKYGYVDDEGKFIIKAQFDEGVAFGKGQQPSTTNLILR